jgi:hypothetical protein
LVRQGGAEETLLVPHAGDTFQFVKDIAAVIEADRPDNRWSIGEGELFNRYRVMVAPGALEFVSCGAI